LLFVSFCLGFVVIYTFSLLWNRLICLRLICVSPFFLIGFRGVVPSADHFQSLHHAPPAFTCSEGYVWSGLHNPGANIVCRTIISIRCHLCIVRSFGSQTSRTQSRLAAHRLCGYSYHGAKQPSLWNGHHLQISTIGQSVFRGYSSCQY
jgi:hypothetical protein